MRFFAQLSLFLSAALSLSAVVANPHSNDKLRRHTKRHGSDISLRARGDVGHLQKRFSNARFTFFADGLGACGITNSPSDFIVALNSNQYGNGEYCFQMITITYNGVTNQAQITDECPGCPYGGLDFSQGLFQAFADLGEGVLYGTWTFDDGAPASSSSPPPPPPPTSTWQPPPSTSSPPPPPPTTSSTPPPPPPPPPTTTWSPSPTPTPTPSPTWSSSSSSSSSSSIASWSSSSVSTSSSSSASPSSTVAGVEVQGIIPVSEANSSSIDQLSLALVYLGVFIGDASMAS